MQYLIKIIEQGAQIEGDQKHLEAALDLAKGTITEVKAGRRGLPIEACYKLVDITGADLARLIAESEAITAKNPSKAEYWKKKLVELEKIAACLIIATVTNFVTPTPAKAAPVLQVVDSTLYIMSNAVCVPVTLINMLVYNALLFMPRSFG